MKKKIFALAALAACLAILTAGSLAYFTAEERAHNIITTGNIAADLEQWQMMMIDGQGEKVPFPEEGIVGVMPGTSISQIVEVKNTGGYDAFIRVKVEMAIELAEGVEGVPDPSLVTPDFNTVNWTEKDGYYYYNDILAPGALTEALFETVTFSATMGNMYQNSIGTVSVTVQAVQVANNGTSALAAAGWPADD